MAQEFGLQLSLIAFATAAIQGLMSGADFQESVPGALVVLVVFYCVGWILGELARRLVEENAVAEVAALTPQRAEAAPDTPKR